MLEKFYFEKEKFYLFTFEDDFNAEKYDLLQVSVDDTNGEYCIWGIEGENAELLDEGFTTHFDWSLLDYADLVEPDEFC